MQQRFVYIFGRQLRELLDDLIDGPAGRNHLDHARHGDARTRDAGHATTTRRNATPDDTDAGAVGPSNFRPRACGRRSLGTGA
jgi:hypothetical protein